MQNGVPCWWENWDHGVMLITEVRPVLLTGPCTDDPWLSVFKQFRTVALIEVVTDSGTVGVGETYAGYFFPESVPLIVDYVRPILINAGAFEPDTLDVRRADRADPDLLPVLGPHRARRGGDLRDRGGVVRSVGQAARPARPPAARLRRRCTGPAARVRDRRAVAVAGRRPAGEGGFLSGPGILGVQGVLGLPGLRHPGGGRDRFGGGRGRVGGGEGPAAA